MDGNSELSQKDQEFEAPKPELQPQRKPLIARITNSVRTAVEALVPIDKRIPLDEINQQIVAEKVKTVKYNLLNERRGENPRSPFTIVDVLVDMNYMTHKTSMRTADYREKFPKEYDRVREILHSFVTEGALEAQISDESDSHKEHTKYKIVDLDLLDEISQRKPPQLTS